MNSRQSPTANSQGQEPEEPFSDRKKKGEEWSPAEGDQDMANREREESDDAGDFDEDETNPSPA